MMFRYLQESGEESRNSDVGDCASVEVNDCEVIKRPSSTNCPVGSPSSRRSFDWEN